MARGCGAEGCEGEPYQDGNDESLASCSVQLLAALSVLAGGLAEGTSAQARKSLRPTHGVCDREAEKIVGREAVRAGGKIRGPKKIRNVSPAYPPFPPGTTGSGMWIGEALVANKGRISRVWTIREVEITPALPLSTTRSRTLFASRSLSHFRSTRLRYRSV